MADEALQELVEQLLEEVRTLKGAVEKRLPTVLSKKHAAQELDISLSKLKGMIRAGQIMVCEVGDTTGVPASEIRRIAGRAAAASAKPPKPERPAAPQRAKPPPRGATSEAEKIRAALRKPKA